MKNVKKFIVYMLTLIMVIASNTLPSSASPEKPIEVITLDKASEMAINNSTKLKLYDEKISNAEKRLSYAVRVAEIRKNDSWHTDEYRKEVKTALELTPVQKRNILMVLKLQKSEEEKSIRINVAKNYYDYLLKETQISDQEKAIDRIKKNIETVKVQLTKGLVTKDALEKTELTLKTAEQQYSKLQRDLDSICIQLNSMLGRPIKTEIRLQSTVIPVKDSNFELDKLISIKKANSSQVLQAANSEQEARIEFDIANYSSTKEIPDGVDNAKNRLLDSSADYKKTISDIECNVLNDYNTLQNLRDDIEISKYKVEVKNIEYQRAKIQYERGITDFIKYNDALQSLESVQMEYENAKLDYYVAYEKFVN